MSVTVQVRQLTKRYGALTALHAVTFDVAPGEVFGVLGPNGAGKTSLLECLLGLRRPDEGAVLVDGADVATEPARARRLVGAQLQGSTLQDKITPREALGLFAAFHGRTAVVDELLESFALREKADARFETLSAGQRQRLAVALAFVNDPRLVVLDEPTVGLDPLSRRELHAMLGARRLAGCTVLLSTHQLDEAEMLCDRVAILDRGRIAAVAKPAELIAASKAPTRLAVRPLLRVDDATLRGLPAVSAAENVGDGWLLTTSSTSDTIAALVRALEQQGNALHSLEIRRPTLEDVFLERTGRKWEDGS